MGRKPIPNSQAASDSEPPDLRAPLLAAAAWAGGWIGTAGQIGWALGAAGVAVALAAIGGRRRRVVTAVAVMLLVAVGVSTARSWGGGHGPVVQLAEQRAIIRCVGIVGEGRHVTSTHGGPMWVVRLRLESLNGRGTQWASGADLMVSASGERAALWQRVAAGTRVGTVARLGVSDDLSLSAWASATGAPQVIDPPGWLDGAVNAVRAGLRQSVAGLPEGPKALVPALVVGDTSAMTPGLNEQFRVTGLTHLTAVSGANLTLMLAAMLWLAARLGVLGWWRRGVAVVGVLGFVLLCRAEPSVLRAAAMGLVGLAGLGWSGPRQGLRYLAWAMAALVMLDPWLARSVGFALSVLASAGILLWSRRWASALAGWMPLWLAEAISVPLAAQLATQPVVTAISGQVSVVGLVANLVAGPLVGPGTVLGFAAAWLSVPLPWLAFVLGWAAGGFAHMLCVVAAAGSALPGAAVSWPATVGGIAVVAAACVAMVAGMSRALTHPVVVMGAVLVLVVAGLRPLNPPGWPPEGWLVVSCDVGQGDSTVIRAGPSAAIVVDAGPDPRAVDRCLDQLGIAVVPWLIFTHPHADHIAGVGGVFSGRQVDQMLLPAVNPDAPGWRQVRQAAQGTPVHTAEPGAVVSAGDVSVNVLSESEAAGSGSSDGESAAENDESMVMRIDRPGLRMLVAGDVQESGQQHAMSRGGDLASDVLLVPHHGSARQSPVFLAATAPKVALISVGADNSYGHPAGKTLNAVAATGATIFRTDNQGAIAVSIADGNLAVTAQKAG